MVCGPVLQVAFVMRRHWPWRTLAWPRCSTAELRLGYYGFGVLTHHRIGSGILGDQLLFEARAVPAGPVLQVAYVM